MNRKLGAVLVLVSTFILGGLAGGALHFLYRNQAIPAAPGPIQSARPPGDIVEDMARSLDLNDDQKQKLTKIFQQSRERYRALSIQFRPQYDALGKETDQQIRQILTSDQAAIFDRLLKEGRERRKLQGPNPGSRGPGIRPPSPSPPPGARD